jgi:hypothetical protein
MMYIILKHAESYSLASSSKTVSTASSRGCSRIVLMSLYLRLEYATLRPKPKMYFKLKDEAVGGTLGFKFGKVPGILSPFSLQIARK